MIVSGDSERSSGVRSLRVWGDKWQWLIDVFRERKEVSREESRATCIDVW